LVSDRGWERPRFGGRAMKAVEKRPISQMFFWKPDQYPDFSSTGTVNPRKCAHF
jgi:hypothetical protein